jgi:hypothetical protein
VAAELEARWNAALERVRDVEVKLESFDTDVSERQPLDEGQLRALAADLPAVWNDETTDMRLKQRIARILLREVIADVDEQAEEIVLTLHWHGGRHTEVRVAKATRGRTRRCTEEDAIELVRRMAGRWTDHAIATALNKMGSHTGAGNHWNTVRVRALRSRMGFPALGGKLVMEPLLTAKLAAQRLGLSTMYVSILCARGVIPATQIAPRSPWWIDPRVIDSDEVKQALRALRERRAVKRNYTNRNLTIPGL